MPRDKFGWDGYRLHFADLELRKLANIVSPAQTLDVTDDPDDNRILECAAASRSSGPWISRNAGRKPSGPQISAVQNLHLVASTAMASLHRGQFFEGAGGAAGASLISALVIMYTTKAMIAKSTRLPKNVP